ncbi:MAG: hypothetical protein ACTSPY_11455 [Candidatus Helarchaeota archaeon]
MVNKLLIVKRIVFGIAIIFGLIIQITIYFFLPLGELGTDIQNILITLFYIPMLIILLTFPIPNSNNKKIIALNILVFCLILSSMNVDYQVIKIFSLLDSIPPDIGTLIWDKTQNLYWAAWMFQLSIVFLIFGLIYRFQKKDLWTSFRISAIGPLISLFSFEDIIYYPMHGENPFHISEWSWLPQHNIYFGRPVNTMELIWIVSISMIIIFLFLILPAIIKKEKNKINYSQFANKYEKRLFLLSIFILIGFLIEFFTLYKNTYIINNQIPLITLIFLVGLLVIFTISASNFPKIKNRLHQLIFIFICYLIFWVAATEMDWNAVEAGFHWIVPSDPRKPPGDFWVYCHYRMAMWLIYLPIIIFLISIIFKSLGNNRKSTLKLTTCNFIILYLGLDSIIIYCILGFNFPNHWNWSNLHYSIFNGTFSIFTIIGFVSIGILILFYIYKKWNVNS